MQQLPTPEQALLGAQGAELEVDPQPFSLTKMERERRRGRRYEGLL